MSAKADVIDPTLGIRFKNVRNYLKLTQAEMAELCEVSQTTISMVEKGLRDLPTSVLKILFIKKNISPTYIITGEGGMEYKKTPGGKELTELRAELEIVKAHLNIN